MFLLVSYLNDLISLVDAVNKKYGFNLETALPEPMNSDQEAEVARLKSVLAEKLGGLIVSDENDNSGSAE